MQAKAILARLIRNIHGEFRAAKYHALCRWKFAVKYTPEVACSVSNVQIAVRCLLEQLSSVSSLCHLYTAISEGVPGKKNLCVATLYLLDYDKKQLWTLDRDSQITALDIDSGLLGAVVASRESIFSKNVLSDARYQSGIDGVGLRLALRKSGISKKSSRPSMYLMPICSKSIVFGVIQIVQGDGLVPQECMFLSAISSFQGIVWLHSRQLSAY